jgi:HlyD family secretion protein
MKQGKSGISLKKIFSIVFLALGVVIIIGLLFFLYAKSKPKDIVYEIEEVKQGDIEATTVATGNISPRDEILIKPQISGIVVKIFKEAGDLVNAGDVIATIQVVPESSQLSSAESQLNIANITLNQATAEYQRQLELFNKGVIAKEEMDQSETAYKKALEDVDNAKDNLDIIKTGVSKKTVKYSNTQIRSTINGMILDIPIKVGNSVIQANNFNDGTTIASVANMGDLIFVGKVDETEVGRIHVGMPIKLSIGAIDDKKFDAALEYVSPKGVEENGAILFEIKAAAKVNDSTSIRAGYSANAQIILGNAHNVLYVPESTISFSNDSAFVYVVKDTIPQQTFEKCHVTTGISNGINIEIKSGLKKGQKVRGNIVSDKKIPEQDR